jgi:squalene synthase HpnC
LKLIEKIGLLNPPPSNAMPTPELSVGHYENFPVASLLLPPALRPAVAVIYRFARNADDFADEGDLPPAERLASLDAYRQELLLLQAGRESTLPLFRDLADVVRDHGLPFKPLFDLLDAFAQDVVKQRYADFGEVMHYCARSANPVGRLMLHLYGAAQPENLEQSDAICSALQLINFWQDVEVDLRKDRIYLPQDELARHGVDEAQLTRGLTDDRWRALMRFQVSRAEALLLSGAPLATRLPGRIGLELRMIVQGGKRICDKLHAVQYDVFRRRPVLKPYDWPLMLARALRM